MLDLTDWQNKKYRTYCGESVRILCVYRKGPYPVIGIITDDNGNEVTLTWTLDGRLYVGESTSPRDLCNAKTKRGGWVNIYPGMLGYPGILAGGIVYPTKDRANQSARTDRVDCVWVEWEE